MAMIRPAPSWSVFAVPDCDAQPGFALLDILAIERNELGAAEGSGKA
jgi:hypothetical protein